MVYAGGGAVGTVGGGAAGGIVAGGCMTGGVAGGCVATGILGGAGGVCAAAGGAAVGVDCINFPPKASASLFRAAVSSGASILIVKSGIIISSWFYISFTVFAFSCGNIYTAADLAARWFTHF